MKSTLLPSFLKRTIGLSFLALLFSAALIWGAKKLESRTVVFESRESKNDSGVPVLNQIRLQLSDETEVWEMRQHHDSSETSPSRRSVTHSIHSRKEPSQAHQVNFSLADFVQITVASEKQKTKQAAFRQYEPGDFQETKQEREYGVSCAMCHSNGPRTVRPNWSSQRAPLGIQDRLTILLWNTRIKLAGPIQTQEVGLSMENSKRKIPLHLVGEVWNTRIQLGSCTNCHGERNTVESATFWPPRFLRRSALSFENLATARHLLKESSMPPPLHSVSPEDRAELANLFQVF